MQSFLQLVMKRDHQIRSMKRIQCLDVGFEGGHTVRACINPESYLWEPSDLWQTAKKESRNLISTAKRNWILSAIWVPGKTVFFQSLQVRVSLADTLILTLLDSGGEPSQAHLDFWLIKLWDNKWMLTLKIIYLFLAVLGLRSCTQVCFFSAAAGGAIL